MPKRTEAIRTWRESNGRYVLIISGVAGVGLNLQRGNILIILVDVQLVSMEAVLKHM